MKTQSLRLAAVLMVLAVCTIGMDLSSSPKLNEVAVTNTLVRIHVQLTASKNPTRTVIETIGVNYESETNALIYYKLRNQSVPLIAKAAYLDNKGWYVVGVGGRTTLGKIAP